MDLNPISITYILIWLREKECPEEIRYLIMDYIKHPVSIIFSKEVLEIEKTFTLHKTYSEGWLWETYDIDEPNELVKSLVSEYWWVRSDMTHENRLCGLKQAWRDYQDEEGIYQGDKVPLWWMRKHEPYYILGSKPNIWPEGPDMSGFGNPILEWGSGIERETYAELVKTILSNRKIKKLFRESKKVINPLDKISWRMREEYIYLVGNINQKNFCRRIDETLARPIDELSLRKNACIHTLLGCRCCNILEEWEHISPNPYRGISPRVKKAYEEFISYGERRKLRKK